MGVNNTFNPDDYMGNVQSAVTAARAAGGAVVLSAGKTYTISAPVVLDWNHAYIGCEAGTATLTTSSNSINLIELATSTTGVVVENLRLTRVPLGTASSCGIRQGLYALSGARIENVHASRHGVGFMLAGTDYSEIKSCRADLNVGHGFQLTTNGNFGTTGPVQWYWSGANLSGQNGGSGLLILALPGAVDPGGASTGNVTNFATFANGAYGVAVLGSATCPLHALRLSDSFIGNDGMDLLYIDSYGSDHVIDNSYFELGNSRGIHFSPNNNRSKVQGCTVTGNNGIGIAAQGQVVSITDCDIWGNGGPGGTGNAWGVYAAAGRTTIVGNRIGNPAAGVGYKQNIGVNGVSGVVLLSSNDLYGNNVVPYTGAASFTHSANIW